MLTLHAIPRGTGLRRTLWNGAHAAVFALTRAIDPLVARLAPIDYTLRAAPGGLVMPYAGFALAEAGGDRDTIGSAWGTMLGPETRRLLRLMRLHPVVAAGGAAVDRLIAAIPDEHRRELVALARAARINERTLLAVNAAVVDAACSALVRGAHGDAPLAVARNLDFFPAAALGRSTVVAVVRPVDRHAFVSIGWPGCLGVVSGLNRRGLAACILLNYDAPRLAGGAPLPFIVRRALEECADVDTAARLVAEDPPASGHYLLLADAERAAVVWRAEDGVHRHDLADGWLACSNGARDPAACVALDERGCRLRTLAETAAHADECWLRRALSATYLPGINVQAMLLVPAERRVQLATGDARGAAALARWQELPLADALAGASIAGVRPRELPRGEPLPHYLLD